MDKLKIIITNKDGRVGTTIKNGNNILDWNALSKDEKIKILNTIATSYRLFDRFR